MSLGTLEIFEQQQNLNYLDRKIKETSEAMKTERINSAQFIELCHANNKKMSQPTLSRKITDNDFVKLVGAKKEMTETSKIPAWTFDANLSKIYAQTLDAKATPEKSTAIIKVGRNLPVKVESEKPKQQISNVENVLLIPHKVILSINDLVALTGLSLGFWRYVANNSKSFFKANGWKISRHKFNETILPFTDKMYLEYRKNSKSKTKNVA